MASHIRLLIPLAAIVGCAQTTPHLKSEAAKQTPARETIAPTESPVLALSWLGTKLVPPDLPAVERDKRERALAEAEAEFRAHPEDANRALWVGRRLAYLYRYDQAIAVYSRGLATHPSNAHFFRHRGHRYITLRQLDRAIADLTRAAELRRGQPDEIEEDGQPNPLGVPTSTLHANIYYHLGLAHFLAGDYKSATDAYRSCLAASHTDDMRVATLYWLYLTLQKAERPTEAHELLASVDPNATILENHAYHQLLLLYRGLRTEAELRLALQSGDAVERATLGYGLANWYLFTGEAARGEAALRQVLTTEMWPAFGYIAAEAELARLAGARLAKPTGESVDASR